ncbi:MAG: hypothetical protein J7L45_01825 [Candidatus Aenigmarchaeota archaeon]|nr:hypothetical protein [Candidatus Aenigmarchaeota archaeon]
MYKKRLVGNKAFITDLDGPMGSCQRVADELSVGEIYERFRNDPSALQYELNGLTDEFFSLAKRISEGFELRPDVGITLKALKLKGYDNFVCTDNPIFGVNSNGETLKKKLMENVQDPDLSEEISYLDELHVTTIPKIVGGRLYFDDNGSKKSYVRKKFEEYGSGILVVDDKNDIDAAKEAYMMKENYDIKILKFGKNCKELEKYCDKTIMNFSEILNYI